jgi:hypothetical protein
LLGVGSHDSRESEGVRGSRLAGLRAAPRESPAQIQNQECILVFTTWVPSRFRVRFVVAITTAIAAVPALATAATITVCSSGCAYSSVQLAVNAAQPGDTVLLRAGQTFVVNLLLPAKSSSSTAYVTIRSDTADTSLPNATTRLVPSGRSGANTSSSLLAHLVGVGGTAKTLPVVRTAPGAHHYKLMFLDIDGKAQEGYETLVAIGTDKADTPPHHIVFDRVYVHGHPTKGQKRGIALNGGSTSILNSYIADVKAANADSQAIGGWNGKGPYQIINNYVEGSGENIMFGGAAPAISGLIPSDIVISGNHIVKPTSWRNPVLAPPTSPKASASSTAGSLTAGAHYFKIVALTLSSTKELNSLPSAEVSATATAGHSIQLTWSGSSGATQYRIYHGTSAGGESKYLTTTSSSTSFLYKGSGESSGTPPTAGTKWTSKNLLELKNAQRLTINGNVFENNWSGDQNGYAIVLTPRNTDGRAPWATVSDLTFTNNIVRHSAAVFNILGYDDTQAAGSALTQRVTIRNNLFYDINPANWGPAAPKCFLLGQGPTDITFDANTVDQQGTTLLGAYGKPTLRFVFTNNAALHGKYGVFGDSSSVGNATLTKYFPSAVFKYNVLAGGTASLYPATNTFPTVAEWNAAFVNPAAGDYHLRSTASFISAGTGGSAPGVNLDILESSSDDISSPPPPTSSLPPTANPGGPYSGAVRADVSVTGAASRSGTAALSTFAWQFGDEIVLDASDVKAADIHGHWQKATMAGTASGFALINPDAGAAKLTAPTASPSSYVDVRFYAAAGVPYYVWFRAQAEGNSYTNDSFFVQFSDSVDTATHAVTRIGTTAGLAMVLEEGHDAGLSGWGWNDANYGGTAPPVYFASSGLHTLRLQPREDGIVIDQIVISSAVYAARRPGLTKNDTTIVPGTLGTATGVTAIHRFAVAGVYPVVLTVTDVAGLQGTATTTATIR